MPCSEIRRVHNTLTCVLGREDWFLGQPLRSYVGEVGRLGQNDEMSGQGDVGALGFNSFIFS